MSRKLKKAIGAVKDQTSISLAKVSSKSSLSNLEVAIVKATSHDDVQVDNKYVAEVLQLVSSNKAHAAACARAIGKRIGRTRNWVVALKSLMLVLRIFQDGDPYFPREVLQAMKHGARILNLSGFRDDSNSSPWDFTSFVRTFALYLDERLECFLTGKLQRRYTQKVTTPTYERSKNLSARRPNELVRDMKPTMLLDRMSHWQRLLDRAIATRPTGATKTNRLVQASLYAIVQESFDLYKDISDGLAIVLDSFYHLQYQNCVAAFQTCLNAIKQFEELNAFYASCKSIGIGRISEYPSVQVISEEVIDTLKEYLKDQFSFSPAARLATNEIMVTPVKVRPSSSLNDNSNVQSPMTSDGDSISEHGSQLTSLEDLINATETETGTKPTISIDLETYSETHRDEIGASETGSTQSMPVSSSIGDLMSLMDWIGEKEKQEEGKEKAQEQELKQKELLESSISSKTPSDNTSNTFSAFQEQPPMADERPAAGNASATGWELELFETPASSPPATTENSSTAANVNNSTNSWELALFEAPVAEGIPATVENTSTTGWELALLEATAAPPPPAEVMNPKPSAAAGNSSNDHSWELALLEGTAAEGINPNRSPAANAWELAMLSGAPPPMNAPPPPSSHYNPFLEDPIELFGTLKDQPPLPQQPTTFQAAPTFSAQNLTLNQKPFGDDPFTEFAYEQKANAPMDPQNLQLQQQLWLQNQSKILAKNWNAERRM